MSETLYRWWTYCDEAFAYYHIDLSRLLILLACGAAAALSKGCQ